MKTLHIILILVGIAVIAGGAAVGLTAVVTCEMQSPYYLLRDTANEDSTTIDLTTDGDIAQKPSSAVEIKVDASGVNYKQLIELIFCGGAANDKTFSYKVYGWRTNGPAELIALGAGTLGTQAVVKYPDDSATATNIFYADTLTNTGDWIGDDTDIADTGNNRVAKLIFDAYGYRWIYVEITNADGSTGTEAGNITVFYAFVTN